jgi:predicted permease
MALLLEKILPILLLIVMGMLIRKSKMISEETINGIKQIIVKIALPSILFTAFSTMKLEVSYLILFVLVFGFCVVLYALGELAHKVLPKLFPSRYTGGFFTGFEFGMIGVGLFGAIWGVDKLPVIMLVGFGHELFIWFVYMPLISGKGAAKESLKKVIYSFVKSPPIIGIAFGVLFNLLNLYDTVGATLIGGSVYATLGFLMPLTSPLILIVIGYSITFGSVKFKDAFVYIGARWLLVMPIGTGIFWVITTLVKGLDPLFGIAFYAFILLPPPYILPIFIEDKNENQYFSQLLVYSTLVSFGGYILLLAFNLNGF